MDIIFKRRSIRKYQDVSVEPEKIRLLLKAGMYAPSACNQREWEFVVVTSQEMRSRLAEISPYTGPAGRAPLVIVPVVNRSRVGHPKFVEQDLGACVQNILLEAEGLGLGGVWMGVMPDPDRMGKIAEILKLPEEIEPFSMVAIGYPAEEAADPNRFEEDRIHYEVYGDDEK